ncbi:MAG: hypothetical protein GXO83_05865 [Chlorobi bacterium]|nr:hypothetical protein [Chlorobiota bacterium]
MRQFFIQVFSLLFLSLLLHFPASSQTRQFPEMKGLKIIQDYPVYHPDDLWDYIDGAADNYLNYHFQELHIAEYAKGKHILYKVEIYRHENDEYAFGIYSAERSPDYHFISLGTQGYRESSLVFFLKGPFYVKVMAMDESRVSEDQLLDLAKAVEALLPGKTVFPDMVSFFPQSGEIPNSERFLAGDFLGRAYLKGFYTAQYKTNDKAFTLFLRRYETPDQAKEVLSRYYEDVMKTKPGDLKEGDFRFDDGYNGVIFLIWKGTVLFGFQNLDDERVMRTMAQNLLKKFSE